MKSKKTSWIVSIGLASNILFDCLFLFSSANVSSFVEQYEIYQREYMQQYRRYRNSQNQNNILTQITESLKDLDRKLAIYSCQEIIDKGSQWQEIETNLYKLYTEVYQVLKTEYNYMNTPMWPFYKVKTIDYLIQKSNAIKEGDCTKILKISYPTSIEFAEFITEVLNLPEFDRR